MKESPQLRFLNLDENQIEKISHLDNLTKLYSLNLNKNLIKKIENISQLVSLEKLSLNYNLIEQIENCEHNSRLKFFSIGKNNIHSIESIENQLLYIEVLILCENNIKFLPENFSLPYLKFLDLNENKISQIDNFLYCPCLGNSSNSAPKRCCVLHRAVRYKMLQSDHIGCEWAERCCKIHKKICFNTVSQPIIT